MRKIMTALAALLILLAFASVTAYAEDVGSEISSELSDSARVTALTVKSYPAKTIYDAFETLDKTGLRVVARFDDGRERELSVDEVEVGYQKDTCLRVGDSHIFLSFGGLTISVPVTVNRVEYDLASLEISDFSVTYNGKFNSYEAPFPDVVGLDGIPLRVKVNGGGLGVGKYDVSIDFETASTDYYTPDTRVITMTVEPYCTEVVWESLSFVYDGKSKVPTARFIDVFGNKIYPEAIGSATNAGSDYTAKVVFNDPNYKLSNTETKYEIKKADYDFKDVKWSKDAFVYDGSSKSISVSGLPSGVRVVSYTGDKATDAGKYTVMATLAWEETNYNAPNMLTHTWEISPTSYDLSGFSFVPGEFVYDGKIHYPKLKGTMPVGKDGIALEYSFSEGACHVAEGTVSCTVNFISKSKNYLTPDPVYSSVTVTPLGIEVLWGARELYYSGGAQAPSAASSECVVKVRGGETDVGKYTAEAYTENTDYYVINSLLEYTIKKSENGWLDLPKNATCYEGRELNLPVLAKFGEVHLVYYSDEAGVSVISAPTAPGTYYAKAVVFSTDNYSGIESPIFSFEIVKITATSFFATLNKNSFKAFERVSLSDLSCTVVNNDGSRVSVDPSLVSVSYQSADSLRRSDEYLTVRYGKFNYKIDVSVDFADYDLSGVFWTNTDTEYDGTAKTPTLLGLPAGVSVKEYIGGGAVSAGRYTVGAILDYDRENYNQPKLEGCTLTVRKKVLDVPTLSVAYNGELQMPTSDSPLYYVTSEEGFRNSGKYNVTATVRDNKNYEFFGGGESCSAYFVITPRVIGITVGEVKLHLFERVGEVEYTIDSGEYAGGDLPMFSKYVEKRTVYLRSLDPNYTVLSSGGAIKRLPYPSLIFTLYFLLVLVILALLGAAVYFGLLRRHRLQNAVAILKCRWRNRNMSAYPPRIIKRNKASRTDKYPEENTAPNRSVTPQKTSDATALPPTEQRSDDGGKDAENTDETEQQTDSDASDEPEWEIAPDAALEVPEDAAEDEGGDTVTFDGGFGMDAERADTLITDSLAKNLINRDGEIIYTEGKTKNIVNVDTLSENFTPGDRVDVNSLKNKSLVPYDTAYIKVLARGIIDKPLTVYANDFSLSAVKMIALTGGEAIKAVTVRTKKEGKIDTEHNR